MKSWTRGLFARGRGRDSAGSRLCSISGDRFFIRGFGGRWLLEPAQSRSSRPRPPSDARRERPNCFARARPVRQCRMRFVGYCFSVLFNEGGVNLSREHYGLRPRAASTGCLLLRGNACAHSKVSPVLPGMTSRPGGRFRWFAN